MGKHKRKTIACSEAARKRMKTYWDRKSKETLATRSPSTSTCGAVAGWRYCPAPHQLIRPRQLMSCLLVHQQWKQRFLAGKLVDEGGVDDDNALLVKITSQAALTSDVKA